VGNVCGVWLGQSDVVSQWSGGGKAVVGSRDRPKEYTFTNISQHHPPTPMA